MKNQITIKGKNKNVMISKEKDEAMKAWWNQYLKDNSNKNLIKVGNHYISHEKNEAMKAWLKQKKFEQGRHWENARIEKERLEKEKIEQEKINKERLRLEKEERERINQERIRLEQEERERINKERIRLEQEKRERKRLEQEEIERKRLEEEKKPKFVRVGRWIITQERHEQMLELYNEIKKKKEKEKLIKIGNFYITQEKHEQMLEFFKEKKLIKVGNNYITQERQEQMKLWYQETLEKSKEENKVKLGNVEITESKNIEMANWWNTVIDEHKVNLDSIDSFIDSNSEDFKDNCDEYINNNIVSNILREVISLSLTSIALDRSSKGLQYLKNNNLTGNFSSLREMSMISIALENNCLEKQNKVFSLLEDNGYYLFHKYLLGLESVSDNINYHLIHNNISEDFKNNKYYAHLHCYDISRFDEIYGEYIDKISEYFSIIITYSIGDNSIQNERFVVLKIPNKGMDIGGKFCAVRYLNDNNIQYDYILFLHSKSNPKTRKKYFEPLINNLDDEFIQNINYYDGYFPDIQWEIVGDKINWVSNNPDFKNYENKKNLPERNNLYRNELLKYCKATNNTNQFIEGNCYILSKKVVNKLYTNPLFYKILNTDSSFDYNWVINAYDIKGNIYKVFKEFTNKNLLPRNQTSFDGYFEHVFERVVLNFCDNYRIFDNKLINIIGLKNINVSIADNLVLLKKYLNTLINDTKIHIYDISELNKINYNIKAIFCIQPFEITNLIPYLSKFRNKPEVLWVWEFKSLPLIFKDYEKYFSKVYVQSQFCHHVFSKHLSIPIEKVELKSIIHDYIDKIPNHKIKDQKINNILENTKNKIIYGFCFDLNSSIVRKNPLNLVKAFNNLNDETKVLILKYRPPRDNRFINKIEYDIYNSFITEVKKNKNIYCITDELEPLDLYKLYTNFDYYISPHCGEGFGITIYDNMVLGNKIISPYYSAETEYLNREDIIELEYEEKEITGLREHPVYGQMKDFKGAYISDKSIENCLTRAHTKIFVIDCQPLQHEIRGIGMYGVNLVNSLIKNYSDKFSFHLIINNFLDYKLINNRIITQETTTIHKINFENIEKSLHDERNVYFNSNEIEYEKILANYINNLRPKYFLNLSEFDRKKVMINIDLLNKNVRTFSILYDLIPLKQGYYDKISEKWTINYNKQLNNLKKYDNLLSISEFTKKDCSDVLNNIETIGTIVNDYEYSFSKEDEQSVLKKFNINKKYIYCQTSFGPNKGLSFLYQQYLKLSEIIKNDILLVFGSNIPKDYIIQNNMNNKNVIITGYLSEEDLHILHQNAWLFVFPSTYEGFGIPPVEAMKHNKPVIVSNNTSLVEVIGNDKFMFNHNEKSCADLITNLYRYQELYNECIENSITRKNLFNSDNVSLRLLSIISKFTNNEIYFNGCHDIIKCKGYSLAEVNYNFTKALSNILNKKINVIEDRDESNYRGIKMFMDYPPDNFDDSYKILTNWGWEESIIPQKFIDKFQKLDFITVMSKYVKDILINNGINVPIFVTPLGKEVKNIEINKNNNMFEKYNTKKYRFLHISSCMDRKGIDELLEAYFKGFTIKDDVSLIIKTIKNIHNLDLWQKIVKYQNIHSPEIHLIYDFYTEEQINALIDFCYAQVLPSKSEGFGFPAIHSMMIKKPVIFTNYSGYLEYGSANPFLIDYTYDFSKSHMNLNHSIVVKPNVDSIINNMKKIINMPVNKLNDILENNYKNTFNFTWENNAKSFLRCYNKFHLYHKFINKKPSIGILCKINPYCGIGNYVKCLFGDDKSKFDNNLIYLQSYNLDIISYRTLDIIIIQYHPSFYIPDGYFDLYFLIEKIKNDGKILIIEMHTLLTNRKGNYSNKVNSAIDNLPNNMHLVDRILVRNIFDMNYLKSKYSLSNNLMQFPLGISNLNNTEIIIKPIITIGMFGYCFPDKGIEHLINSFIKLNNPDLKLKLLTASSGNKAFSYYENSLINLISNSGNRNISINLDYIPESDLSKELKDIDLFVQTSKDSLESTSASIRSVLTQLKPCIVPNTHNYNDLDDNDFIFKYDKDNINDLENKIKDIINYDKYKLHSRLLKQKNFVKENLFNYKKELLLNVCSSLFINKDK